MSTTLPSRLLITAGTYDGVLAGWEKVNDNDDTGSSSSSLKLSFATPVHEGSVRGLCISSSSSSTNDNTPGTLLSCGYDETLKTHDLQKRLVSSGEIKTPADFGTPSCVQFIGSSHVLVGFSSGSGKLVLYKKRDWNVQHVLAGHEGGVESLAVHPSGKMCLTGGSRDGKLKLWDLTRGRLAHAEKAASFPVASLVWSRDGQAYAYARDKHVVVRQTTASTDLLNVELPSRVNELCLMQQDHGGPLVVAAACNDGSLPVLLAEQQDEDNGKTRRAIMAIEPTDTLVAREERFKCIQYIGGYLVATANSAGVVSVMDLSGAVKMITEDDKEEENDGEGEENYNDSQEEQEEEEEFAVDIVESTMLGTGARITSLAVWSFNEEEDIDEKPQEQEEEVEEKKRESDTSKKRKATEEMDDRAVQKARALVHQAKKLKSKKEKKQSKKKKRGAA